LYPFFQILQILAPVFGDKNGKNPCFFTKKLYSIAKRSENPTFRGFSNVDLIPAILDTSSSNPIFRVKKVEDI